MSKARIAVALLTLSFAGFLGMAAHESYTEQAVIPTKGDRPTYGFGSTIKDDGKPVRMGDRTDPVRALHTVQAHLAREESAFRESLPGVSLTQGEYDLYMDFTYQYGIANWRASSMRRSLLAGEHAKACGALLRYRFADGYDCSTPGNKRCAGVWTRQKERHSKCMAEQG